MTATKTLAERSAAANRSRLQIDLERAAALITLAETPAMQEVLEAATALYDPSESSGAGVNEIARNVVVVLGSLAATAEGARVNAEARLNPPAPMQPVMPAPLT